MAIDLLRAGLRRFPGFSIAFLLGFFALALPGATSPSLHAQEIVTDGARSYLNLGGQWNVLPIEGLAFHFPPPAGGWKSEKVPGVSAAFKSDNSGYGGSVEEYLTKDKSALRHPTGNAAWFRRSFELPKNFPKGQNAQIYFEGMAFKSEVWLNGKKLGGSLLGQVPSRYDVTEVMREGANDLVIGLTGRTGLVDIANQTLLAPHWGNLPGIWGKVELQFLPRLRMEYVRVNTSVKNKQIGLEVRVINTGKETRKFTLDAVIVDSQQNPQTRITSAPDLTLAPGESKFFALEKDWIAPNLWSPANAALYFAKISLKSDSTVADAKTVRFGFREFEIRGADFYLNGVKTTLLRNSHLFGLDQTRDQVFTAIRGEAGRPYNCIRLHGGFNCEDVLNLCDEMGLMAMPEGAWHQADSPKFNVEKSEVWLPAIEDYYTRLIEKEYNHPSVIMWSITNETYWGETNPERMKIAERLIATCKAADSTRPVQGDAEVTWGGRLPVIGIHYPEFTIENSLRAKFPNSAFVFPNDFYWLKKDGINESWRAKFKWDRPLVIGEYWYPTGDADSKTSFMGESVYDWEKWRIQRMDGVQDENRPDNEFVKSQQGLADAYRIQGVAGLNPWSSDGQKVIPSVAVHPVDFFPNFFGGTTNSRKFAVVRDRGGVMDLQCRLSAGGQTLWENRFPVEVGPGEMKTFEVKVDCPAVTRPVKATLTVRLCDQSNGGNYQLDRYEGAVYLLPRASLADLKTASLRLLDATGATAKALASLGLKLEPLAKITSADLKGAKVVIVGENTDTSEFKDALVEFVTEGGSLVVLRQDHWVPLTGELPVSDKDHVSTRSWRRTFDHPIIAGLEDEQFSYWRPDHLVSLKTFRKPAGGNFRALLDCGGLYGLNWTPLVEVPLGRGTVVLTSFDLIGRVVVEPVSGPLLDGIIRYAENFKPIPVAPLRLLAGADARPLRATLKAAGVVAGEGLKGSGPILLDASFGVTPAQITEIRSYLSQGGNVWLHGFSSQTIGKVAGLFPFKPELKPRDATVRTAIRRSEDPWMNNLSSQDFCWAKIDLEFAVNTLATAALGGEVLQLPAVQSGVRLIEPALLVKVPVGQGALLFDTLDWENALGAETDKVTRLASSLSANLGAEVRSTVDKSQYDYFPVNLQPYANMGYYDRVAKDGKGGWTDDGESDMRFFLINHVGKSGGVETGMEIQAEPFPAEVTFAGRPFTLTDPRQTGNHSIISLRGGDHGALLPTEAKGIEVGRKADKLWFLQAAGWAPPQANQEVARYVIHYQDGTATDFPIRFGIEVGDYWTPAPMGGARVAWTGRNLVHSPVGIFSAEWANPFPAKVISRIDVIGNLTSTQFVVVAITGGVIKGHASEAQTVSDWQLDQFVGHAVPNRVPGGPPLKAENAPPTLSADPKISGLKFAGGQYLVGGKIPELSGFAAPFSLQMTFRPDAKTGGASGGLFEAMVWGRNGFRLLLNKGSMKLNVEVFAGDTKFFASRTVLDIGRTYALELRFDGTYVTLLIDGQTDVMKEMPLPAPYGGGFRIGVAGGGEDDFNGIISAVRLSKLSAF